MKCQQCGFDPDNIIINQPLNHSMAVYVNDETGKIDGTYNSDMKYITVKGVKLRRQDVPKLQSAPQLTNQELQAKQALQAEEAAKEAKLKAEQAKKDEVPGTAGSLPAQGKTAPSGLVNPAKPEQVVVK